MSVSELDRLTRLCRDVHDALEKPEDFRIARGVDTVAIIPRAGTRCRSVVLDQLEAADLDAFADADGHVVHVRAPEGEEVATPTKSIAGP